MPFECLAGPFRQFHQRGRGNRKPLAVEDDCIWQRLLVGNRLKCFVVEMRVLDNARTTVKIDAEVASHLEKEGSGVSRIR